MRQSSEIIVVDCSPSVNYGDISMCTGYITRYIIRKVKGNIYAITEIIIDTGLGVSMYSVSLKTGIKLYRYVNSDGRSQRMNEVKFYLTILKYKQSVVAYTAYDSGEWIGDITAWERKV